MQDEDKDDVKRQVEPVVHRRRVDTLLLQKHFDLLGHLKTQMIMIWLILWVS